MLTFQQMYEEVQAQVEDSDTTSLILIKRAINQGMQKFGSILNRQWRVQRRTFSTVADQQYYQLPEDCIRPKGLVITIGNVQYTVEEVADEESWNRLNMYQNETSDIPEKYFVSGNDLIGVWPIPSASHDSAAMLAYEARMRKMTAADYTTGTIAVTNGSAAVVGTGTTFTAAMVGRTLMVEDAASQEGIPYKVAVFTDATHITLENYYAGATGSGKSYRIGEVPDIPPEFHESLIDYALYRYYKRRRDRGMYADAKAAFDEAVLLCRDSYSSTSSSQYVRRTTVPTIAYAYPRRDLKVVP